MAKAPAGYWPGLLLGAPFEELRHVFLRCGEWDAADEDCGHQHTAELLPSERAGERERGGAERAVAGWWWLARWQDGRSTHCGVQQMSDWVCAAG